MNSDNNKIASKPSKNNNNTLQHSDNKPNYDEFKNQPSSNESDLLLFDFFYDLSNIINYKNDYNTISNIYTKSTQALHLKKYSDINVQDEYGNTFLHYCLNSISPVATDFSIFLLQQGADIEIKNLKNTAPRPIIYSSTYISFFKHLDQTIFLDERFKKYIQQYPLMHTNTINYLFQYSLTKTSHYSTIKEAESHLLSTPIDNHLNHLKVLNACLLHQENFSSIYNHIINLENTPITNSLKFSILSNKLKNSNLSFIEYDLFFNFINNNNFDLPSLITPFYSLLKSLDLKTDNKKSPKKNFYLLSVSPIIYYTLNLILNNKDLFQESAHLHILKYFSSQESSYLKNFQEISFKKSSPTPKKI